MRKRMSVAGTTRMANAAMAMLDQRRAHGSRAGSAWPCSGLCRSLAWVLFLCCVASVMSSTSAHAQATSDRLRISEPVDGSVVAPGQTLRVVVDVAPGDGFSTVQV